MRIIDRIFSMFRGAFMGTIVGIIGGGFIAGMAVILAFAFFGYSSSFTLIVRMSLMAGSIIGLVIGAGIGAVE